MENEEVHNVSNANDFLVLKDTLCDNEHGAELPKNPEKSITRRRIEASL